MRGSRIIFQGGGGGGGGGVQARRPENSLDFFFSFFSPQLILQFSEAIQWFYNRENYTFEGSRGGPTFPGGGGGNFFHGVQMLISLETHMTSDFPGGGGSGPPNPPLDPHLLLGLFDM